MPNYCGNQLTVKGDANEINKFVKSIQTQTEDGENISILKNLYPCPQELYDVDANGTVRSELVQKYGHSDWYGWSIANWGTKWGDWDTHLISYEEGDEIALLRFTTAWSPAINGILKISEKFPKLLFVHSYEEGGMGFLGTVGMRDGNVLAEREGEYPNVETDEDGEGDWDKQMEDLDKALDTCIAEVMAEIVENYPEVFGQPSKV